MALSGMYGQSDESESLRTIHAAIERGMTLLDTGDYYGAGHNELLIGRAITGARGKVQVSVKFGALRGPDGSWLGMDTRPASVKNFASYSLKRLGIEAIDIYRPGRLDPNVPIEETIGAIAELVKAGYVRHIGLSEVGVETIRRARAVHPIADLQIEYSLASRSAEAKIFPLLKELGIGATLYGVLSRGLLSGSAPRAAGDFRAYLPRFSGAARATNDAVVTNLAGFARERGMSAAQLAIAWVLARQPGFVPLIGARTQAQLQDAFAALERPLTDDELAALERIAPDSAFAGERYGAEAMRQLDSER
jgi:aryl-alcohol dehydrogenase-like predicted oxidoreductase